MTLIRLSDTHLSRRLDRHFGVARDQDRARLVLAFRGRLDGGSEDSISPIVLILIPGVGL